MSEVHYFRTMPKSTSESYPHRIIVAGDLGLTYNTSAVLTHILSNHPDLVVLIGGFSYADTYLANRSKLDCSSRRCDQNRTSSGCDSCYNSRESYQPRWDYWGRFMEPLTASVPTMMVAGEHEIEPQFKIRILFERKWFFLSIVLFLQRRRSSFHSDQYIWLESDLRNIKRSETPWVVATWSLPWYSTFKGHYREAESLRTDLEDLLYSYQLDIVFNSQVDAYERSNRVYNYTLDQCGPVYITIGAGPVNDELCPLNQPDYSAYRESSFGIGMLEVSLLSHLYCLLFKPAEIN
ncbi:Purple acid phosphatase 13 [Raphanus sativus]|nr:Purple acid phosphatase 13 [Raphanus sativus]